MYKSLILRDISHINVLDEQNTLRGIRHVWHNCLI